MEQDLPDYYEILGVTSSATAEEITRAYRKAMHAVHPDASGTTGLFRLVKTAHDTLKNPISRAAYDTRHAGPPPSPPPPPPPRPQAHPEPDPVADPGPGATARTAGPGRPAAADGPASAVRARPRFGAHWIKVAAVAAGTVACLTAVYACWPVGLPAGLGLLLILPLAAAPIIAMRPASTWPWGACALPFAGTAVLAVIEAGHGTLWPLCAALTGLTLGGVALGAAPSMVRRGRELDELVSRDSLGYQVFNLPGAGLGSMTAREVAQVSAGQLERLAGLSGLRIVHGLTPPQLPGQARCYVDHAVMRDNRLAVVMTRRWPAAAYAWTDKGALTADGHRFPGGDTGITAAVRSLRKVVPRGVRVHGFVAVLPDNPVNAPRLAFAPAQRDDLYAGTVAQVYERLAAWLGEARPVVRRRVFAALLPHVRRP